MPFNRVLNTCGQGVGRMWEHCGVLLFLYTEFVRSIASVWISPGYTQLVGLVFHTPNHTQTTLYNQGFYTVSTLPTIVTTKKENYL